MESVEKKFPVQTKMYKTNGDNIDIKINLDRNTGHYLNNMKGIAESPHKYSQNSLSL